MARYCSRLLSTRHLKEDSGYPLPGITDVRKLRGTTTSMGGLGRAEIRAGTRYLGGLSKNCQRKWSDRKRTCFIKSLERHQTCAFLSSISPPLWYRPKHGPIPRQNPTPRVTRASQSPARAECRPVVGVPRIYACQDGGELG